MPPRGVKSAKRKRQYEHIKESARKQGRSSRRAKQIAAATVNKQRREAGQTKKAKSSRKTSSSRKRASSRKTSGSRKRSSSATRKSSSRKTSSKKK